MFFNYSVGNRSWRTSQKKKYNYDTCRIICMRLVPRFVFTFQISTFRLQEVNTTAPLSSTALITNSDDRRDSPRVNREQICTYKRPRDFFYYTYCFSFNSDSGKEVAVTFPVQCFAVERALSNKKRENNNKQNGSRALNSSRILTISDRN